MAFFKSEENRIKCGRCSTEFDANKNKNGCPLCGFGKNDENKKEISLSAESKPLLNRGYLRVPADLKLESGKIMANHEAESVGNWGMFNSFFPGKAVARVLANMLKERNSEWVPLNDLLKNMAETVNVNNLSEFRGFPKPEKDSSMGRLVYHFIKPFSYMGLFIVRSKKHNNSEEVWKERLEDIQITLTKEGLQFAKLRNSLFDDENYKQVLTKSEKEWLVDYLKQIDKKKYKEFTILKQVFEFINAGKNGKQDLWNWFSKNKNFIDYVKKGSRKTEEKELNDQIYNLSVTFAAGKLALLRELGVIQNKRNDYTVIGEFK